MIRFIVTTSLHVLLWIAVVIAGFLGVEWLTRPPVVRGDFSSLHRYLTLQLEEATARKRVGSAALILINNGSLAGEHIYNTAEENGESRPGEQEMLYLLGSVSKAITAWGVMKLVEDQKIGLDEPILPYLTRWKFPGSEAYREEVTIRHLLSHTSGLVDGFGYSGFPWRKSDKHRKSRSIFRGMLTWVSHILRLSLTSRERSCHIPAPVIRYYKS